RVGAGVTALPRAVHVRIAIGPEALGPVVPAAGLGGVHQLQRLADAIRPDPHLVEIDRHARHVRRPARMKQHLRVIERTRRGVNNLTPDASVLAGHVWLLAEFDERVLAGEALPTLAGNPRWIDSPR